MAGAETALAFGHKLPEELAAHGIECIEVAVVAAQVDASVHHCGRGTDPPVRGELPALHPGVLIHRVDAVISAAEVHRTAGYGRGGNDRAAGAEAPFNAVQLRHSGSRVGAAVLRIGAEHGRFGSPGGTDDPRQQHGNDPSHGKLPGRPAVALWRAS
jgi:hypothetical protein